MEDFWKLLGLVAGAGMPLFNIPLMVRIFRRKSCADISLTWLFGVWGCIVLMFPSTLVSDDIVLRAFGWSNIVLFSCVVMVVMYFRCRPGTPPAPGNPGR